MSSDARHESVVAVLSNVRSLRAFAREVSYEFLLEASEKLQGILAERQDEHLAEQKKLQEEQQKLAKVRKYMEEIGLDPALLIENPASSEVKKTGKQYRPVVAPKYRITDVEGNTHEWSGRGKPPAVFKAAFESGKSKDEFLIDKSV